MLREYQQEIEKLRAMVDGGVNVGRIVTLNKLFRTLKCPFLVPNEELLEEERNKIREEYENEMLEMREKYTNEQKSKAKMASEVKSYLEYFSI